MRIRKSWRNVILVILIILGFLYVNNSSLFTKEREGEPLLLAHRGIGQTFPMEGIESDTCTASRIYIPEHAFLENTIPSMKAAFDAGADIVELDIKPTKDGQFAVFHDWTLECRTNAHGSVKDYTMEQLKSIDIGYGYTADQGATYPFRGKGVGLMPSLSEVLAAFPDGEFLIHIKSQDAGEGELLAAYLAQLPEDRLSRLTVYGDDAPISELKSRLPAFRVMSMDSLKSCLISYIGAGWSGYMPSVCRNTQLHIPEKYAPYLWGWPDKFLNRMDRINTRVILVAGDGGWSEGFDTVEDLKRLPKNYSGGIWTNRVDVIAPELTIKK
ncbi:MULTISPECIES: glycerophosphodiester phosphodiesterase family protein [Paenibacillus]|jgi:glycerophosphoryl diester phosphodiesterase|uniref:Glycerophosphoryl diester phosphodiesterase n=1 Tax=Paenibacillus lactis TaxID=228574 RepID=A0ABS4F4Z3_9BACL|nr:glycerophosphodiester phosphodiesterase family protein [Paenibacillus lactis]MBP1891324.1 glycerophosphoryl diester phosphodiesterase [Paenibacillus lactis]GIO93907.1 glycerophosphoryl diester phosphodiesterase [Paenibacillus lactis]HAF98304.1 glycerophosphodiester phosphodiesterase [Paenibacillus lactis]